ncbi:MAG TPA: hypothetical protein VH370_16845 [Humisphaera sp.]|nr:hypothetical protein [Humisphaera sp.]
MSGPDAVARLRSLVEQMLTDGKNQTIILKDLETLRAELRIANNEKGEDAVMDVMDFLVGWCSPQMRLLKPPQ